MPEPRLGFIGAGRMAQALARGLVQAKLTSPASIVASDPSPAATEEFKKVSGGRIVDDNIALLAEAETIVLAVKPQHAAAVLKQLRARFTSQHLLVSIAAGVTLDTMAEHAGPAPRLVRVMPNTPCLVGQGASGYALGSTATAEDGKLVGQLLGALGIAERVEEKLLDAVTGLSGSGPAFVYLMIEALADGGVLAGLPRHVAQRLAAQTVRGAAEMVLSTGEHPGALKDAVASPGGTTIAGLASLEQSGVRGALIAAVAVAARRATELGAGETATKRVASA